MGLTEISLDEVYPVGDGLDDEQLIVRMGIAIHEAGPARVVASMPVEGNRQPMGILHGGANAVLAETVGSIAARLHAGLDGTAVGLVLTCTHVRAAMDGRVTAVAEAVQLGDGNASYSISITDVHGRLTCTAHLTAAIRRRRRRRRS